MIKKARIQRGFVKKKCYLLATIAVSMINISYSCGGIYKNTPVKITLGFLIWHLIERTLFSGDSIYLPKSRNKSPRFTR